MRDITLQGKFPERPRLTPQRLFESHINTFTASPTDLWKAGREINTGREASVCSCGSPDSGGDDGTLRSPPPSPNYTPGGTRLENVNRRSGKPGEELWRKLRRGGGGSSEDPRFEEAMRQMADWWKPRQHICVALATERETGADHWIQMWECFGVPVPISRMQLPFFPPPSEFLKLDSKKCDWGNATAPRSSRVRWSALRGW